VIRTLLSHPRARQLLAATVTLAAFAYLFAIVDWRQLVRALAQISPAAWIAGVGLSAAALGCGVCRWWLLFRAFGAPRQPRLTQLARHYLVGLFYNTYLPGGVTGDVVRGFAVRDAFEPGSPGGFATVVVERALGLSALLGVTASAMLVHPLPGTAALRVPALCAFAVGLAAMLALAWFGRLAKFVPGRLRALLQKLPVPRRWSPLLLAFVLSLGSQLAPALCGYTLLHAIVPDARVGDALVIVPLAAAASFLPISVSGAGVRETLFVELYARVHVPEQAALAAALGLWATQALLAAIGGSDVLLSAVRARGRGARTARE
jgi:uncharacterized membrane protein YbhN (UPF0104 family)